MAGTSTTRWKCIVLLAAILALAAVARLPYLRQANLSPDAADYLNIARNVARGDGLTLSIKWHFFTDDPTIHSALGERPILYPLLLAPFCRGEDPALAGQYVTVFFALLAAALGVAWARRAGLSWRVAAIGGAILAFNPGLLMCSVFCWTEPLYLCWLFVILIVVGDDPNNRKRAWPAALLTVAAFLTRPTAPAIALGLCVWYGRRRAFAGLAHYLVALFLFLLPWWLAVWAARGTPFYSLQGFHLSVLNIEEGMAAGYGVAFPGPAEFIFSHMTAILVKIGTQTLDYLVQLFGPTFLSVFSAFLLLRVFRGAKGQAGEGGPWLPVAVFHFLMPALTWATVDVTRFMLPCFALFLMPALSELDAIAEQRLSGRMRAVLWTALLIIAGLPYFSQWVQLYARADEKRQEGQAMQVARIEFDRMVEKDAVIASVHPFQVNYYFDRPAIEMPQPRDQRRRPNLVARFADEYRPDYFVLKDDGVRDLSPLISNGRLQPVGRIESLRVSVFRTREPAGDPKGPQGGAGAATKSPVSEVQK